MSLTVPSLLCNDTSKDPPIELIELATDPLLGLYLDVDGLVAQTWLLKGDSGPGDSGGSEVV